jgi:hypothetical protein
MSFAPKNCAQHNQQDFQYLINFPHYTSRYSQDAK